ncbi:hypothetical protein ALQ10_02221 [Pseudomonas savastanoi pv. glycinea]|nr:Unknown protein sequence [Pseudomonas savastanoi pv. glycinea]RMQ25458.1 hypothetical protein ALQ10_02221 [Pseudomonas savastanoi pv. glycinea]RMU22670.1 hypothetical protein ALP34_01644 [Pseudomonas savastanoi pv. glycinea]
MSDSLRLIDQKYRLGQRSRALTVSIGFAGLASPLKRSDLSSAQASKLEIATHLTPYSVSTQEKP